MRRVALNRANPVARRPSSHRVWPRCTVPVRVSSTWRGSATAGESCESSWDPTRTVGSALSVCCIRNTVTARNRTATAGGVSGEGRARATPMPNTAAATRASSATAETGSQPRWVYEVGPSATWTPPHTSSAPNPAASARATAAAGVAARCHPGRGWRPAVPASVSGGPAVRTGRRSRRPGATGRRAAPGSTGPGRSTARSSPPRCPTSSRRCRRGTRTRLPGR